MYNFPPFMDAVLSEGRILWVGIFRGEFSRGEFHGWEVSRSEFWQGKFS